MVFLFFEFSAQGEDWLWRCLFDTLSLVCIIVHNLSSCLLMEKGEGAVKKNLYASSLCALVLI